MLNCYKETVHYNYKTSNMGFNNTVYVLTLVISVVIIFVHVSDANGKFDLYI